MRTAQPLYEKTTVICQHRGFMVRIPTLSRQVDLLVLLTLLRLTQANRWAQRLEQHGRVTIDAFML